MTQGFNPRTGKWQVSIEISAGKRRVNDLESETMRRIQEMSNSNIVFSIPNINDMFKKS